MYVYASRKRLGTALRGILRFVIMLFFNIKQPIQEVKNGRDTFVV